VTTYQEQTIAPTAPSGAAVESKASKSDLAARLLDVCVEMGASDVHINPGSPPVMRAHGSLERVGGGIWGADATEAFCRALCDEKQWAEVAAVGTTDFGFVHRSGDSFRASVLRQRNGYGAVLRRIDATLLTFDQIGLPPVTADLLDRHQGLILVTGATGSGKSTTLAAMVDWINEQSDRHIVTIEDPVEFRHGHKRGLVTQREVGQDVASFPEAMRRVLRQDPDVVLLGEMRDLETIAAALTAAETGHLVLGTLHTTGSAQTVSRIIDAFPVNQQPQVRVQLGMSLLAVISQVLIRTDQSRRLPDGSPPPKRVAGLEVMISTPAIANQIRQNQIGQIRDVMQTSRSLGMFTLEDHLRSLVERGYIDADTAVRYAQDPKALAALLGTG